MCWMPMPPLRLSGIRQAGLQHEVLARGTAAARTRPGALRRHRGPAAGQLQLLDVDAEHLSPRRVRVTPSQSPCGLLTRRDGLRAVLILIRRPHITLARSDVPGGLLGAVDLRTACMRPWAPKGRWVDMGRDCQ